MVAVFHTAFSEEDFQRVVAKCREIPAAESDFRVNDYVENMLLTVLDFQMRSATVGRAMEYFSLHAQKDVANFDALKNLLAKYPDTQEGNRELAQYLWGYNMWTRAELLRRLLAYFEAQGVTTQEHLQQWAAQAVYERDFKGQVKGAGYAIFQWLVMRQGVETVKPDVWLHRFMQEVLGYSVRDEVVVELLKEVALELEIKAYDLDWRIWKYQAGRS